MGNIKKKWGIKIDKQFKGRWSFGICLSHDIEEIYVFINFAKWSISIGKLIVYDCDE